ncbi:19210_t:CDS:2, partial [Racocetra persica]
TEGKVVTVTFNSQLCLATISLDNRINTTLNLEASRAILIKEDISSKIINKHAGFIIDDVPRIQRTEDKQINKISKITEKDQNLILRKNISGDNGSDDDLPEWSEYEECYESKKEFCDFCGSGNWYCMRCSRKSKHKTQSDDSSSSDNMRKIKKLNGNRKRKLLLDHN